MQFPGVGAGAADGQLTQPTPTAAAAVPAGAAAVPVVTAAMDARGWVRLLPAGIIPLRQHHRVVAATATHQIDDAILSCRAIICSSSWGCAVSACCQLGSDSMQIQHAPLQEQQAAVPAAAVPVVIAATDAAGQGGGCC